jgi:hypothetical protein
MGERHGKAAGVRCREQLLGRRVSRSALRTRLPAQTRVLEHAAGGTGRTVAVDQIAFPCGCRPTLHLLPPSLKMSSFLHAMLPASERACWISVRALDCYRGFADSASH